MVLMLDPIAVTADNIAIEINPPIITYSMLTAATSSRANFKSNAMRCPRNQAMLRMVCERTVNLQPFIFTNRRKVETAEGYPPWS